MYGIVGRLLPAEARPVSRCRAARGDVVPAETSVETWRDGQLSAFGSFCGGRRWRKGSDYRGEAGEDGRELHDDQARGELKVER